MKNIWSCKFLSNILCLVALLFLAISCNDESVENPESKIDGKAHLRINVSSETSGSRTIFPEVLSLSDFNKFELSGVCSEKTISFGEWNSFSKMNSADILCDAGIWNFTLSAFINDTLAYTGTLSSVIIKSGVNSLNFQLSLATSSPGNVDITLYFPKEEQIKSVKAGLFSSNTNEELSEFPLNVIEIKTSNEKSFVTYKRNSVPVGNYFIKFYFYRDVMCQDQMQTPYMEIVQVKSLRTSSAIREISDVEHLNSISYELNGGEFPQGTELPLSFTKFQKIDFPTPQRIGYDFIGWYWEEDFKNLAENIPIGTARNVVLYAKWNPIVYTITYNTDWGESPAENPRSYTIEDDTIILAAAVSSKSGKEFVGWYSDENFENQITSIFTNVLKNIIVYAKWVIVYHSIAYTLNGGEFSSSTEVPSSFTEFEITTLPTPQRTGYNFIGWYFDEKFKTRTENIPIETTSNIVLYAKWEPIVYTITYQSEWGENSPENPTTYTIEDETITLKDAVSVKNGYKFSGWYTDSEYSSSQTQIPKGSIGNITLYARYFSIWSYPSQTPTLTWTGSGIENDPYLITTPQQLADLSYMVNNGTSYEEKSFALGEDIDLNSGYIVDNQNSNCKSWMPIGNKYYAFNGIFDGKKHTINGLYIDIEDSSLIYAGLFGVVDGGTIKNLIMGQGYIYRSYNLSNSSGGSFIGAVVGYLKNNSTIDSCGNESTIINSGNYVWIGGVVGYAYGQLGNFAYIKNSYNKASVRSNIRAGGIAGVASLYCYVCNCYNVNDNIIGSTTGGIIGSARENQSSSVNFIFNCYNKGAIYYNPSNGSPCGGVVGDSSYPNTSIKYCYSLYDPVCGNSSGVSSSDAKYNGIIDSSISVSTESGYSGRLVDCLNNWVNEQNSSEYKYWVLGDDGWPVLDF